MQINNNLYTKVLAGTIALSAISCSKNKPLHQITDKNNSIWSRYDSLGLYINRWEAEYNDAFYQIIPYIIVTNEDESKFFISKRIKGDERLLDVLSLGFGGHINPIDGFHEVILHGLTRELNEELDIDPISRACFVGTIKDSTSPTHEHIGLVFAIKAEKNKVFIKEKNVLEGKWVTKKELFDEYSKFENWSKYIIDYLYDNKC